MQIPIIEIPQDIAQLCRPYESLFSKPQFLQFERFITALMVTDKADIEALSEGYKAVQSYDRLHHFATEASWEINDVLERSASTIKQLPFGQRCHDNGMLIIDDSLIEKYGKAMAAVGKLWDHSQGRYLEYAHCLVGLIYADHKGLRYPLQFDLYRKEEDCQSDGVLFRSKIKIASELIEWATRQGILYQTVVFDSWFFASEFVELIESLGKDWISMAKSNRLIVSSGETISLAKYAQAIDPTTLPEVSVEGKRYRIKSIQVGMPSLHIGGRKVRLIISYQHNDNTGDWHEPVFLVSNRLDIRPERLIRAYQVRWSIETFFRDTKEELGLEDYQVRRLKGIKSHWCLVFTSAVVLELVRHSVCAKEGLKRSDLSIGQLRQRAWGRSLRSIITWCLIQHDNGLSHEEIYMKLKI